MYPSAGNGWQRQALFDKPPQTVGEWEFVKFIEFLFRKVQHICVISRGWRNVSWYTEIHTNVRVKVHSYSSILQVAILENIGRKSNGVYLPRPSSVCRLEIEVIFPFGFWNAAVMLLKSLGRDGSPKRTSWVTYTFSL